MIKVKVVFLISYMVVDNFTNCTKVIQTPFCKKKLQDIIHNYFGIFSKVLTFRKKIKSGLMDDEEDHITEAMRECRLAIEGTNGGTDIIYWSPQNPPCHEYPGPPCFTYPLYAAIMPDRNA